MTHPFRFGVQLSALPGPEFAPRLRQIEALGYSSVFFPDHFGPQYEPVAALAAAAALTTKLRVGSLVYGVDYRHPVVLAKAAATIQLLSGGRHEFGLGAGWMRSDYDQAGMAYERAGLRIERLDEALTVIRSMCDRPPGCASTSSRRSWAFPLVHRPSDTLVANSGSVSQRLRRASSSRSIACGNGIIRRQSTMVRSRHVHVARPTLHRSASLTVSRR